MGKLLKLTIFVTVLVANAVFWGCGEEGSSSPDYEESSSSDGFELSSEKNGSSSEVNSSATSSSSAEFVQSSSQNLQLSSGVTSNETEKSSASFEYGTLVDSRDGQTYKTVTIGTQAWMAENLNYAPDSTGYIGLDKPSWCYANNADSCAKYGRLYTWAAAMDSVGAFSETAKGCGDQVACSSISSTTLVRGVCPSGWHLPNSSEWGVLLEFVATSSNGGAYYDAGAALKAVDSWIDNANGFDAYGFSILPAGLNQGKINFENVGKYAYFWSASENVNDSEEGVFVAFVNEDDNAYIDVIFKDRAFSVRCLKD